MAHAHAFMTQLPQVYINMLWNRVNTLFCRQRKSVILARSLIREGRVLLLDGVTSAFDDVAERARLESLKGAACGRLKNISIP